MKLDNRYRHGVAILALLIVIVTLVLISKSEVEEVLNEQLQIVEVEVVEEVQPAPILTSFDPNTVELSQLLEMGVDKSIAVNLLRFRAAGKIFRIKEELIECRGFSDSLYFALEPYITIGEQYRYKPKNITQTPQPVATPAPEEEEVNIDSIANTTPFRARYPERPKEGSINLNTADSATLVALSGIGAKSAEAIIRYRKLLGGYHSVTQLFEIPIITEENFSRFYKYFYANIVDISKIDINFASADVLSGHPYFTAARVKRLIKKRNTKGGWRNIEEIIEDNIFTREEALHVHPYLVFNNPETPE